MDTSGILSLLFSSPSQGGINASNYPNPYGLRAFKTKDGYGGEMMPKTTGWQGLIPSLLDSRSKITEYSMGGENGEPFFPMVTEGMTPEMIQNLRMLEAGKLPTSSKEAMQLQENAYQQYLLKKSMGQSPFKDYN